MTQNAPHILVVDDELSMRELLEYMLAKENYKVTCAESGKEAIARLEKDHFDLLSDERVHRQVISWFTT